MVPRWVRGNESAEIALPPRHTLAILGLGGSVATPPEGIEADVVVVGSFDELRTARWRGQRPHRVVQRALHDLQRHRELPDRWCSCRLATRRRGTLCTRRGSDGASNPAYGSLQYGQGAPPIPAASVSAEDADRIARLRARGVTVRVRLSMEARTEADVESANVVGEIRGRELPQEDRTARRSSRLVGCWGRRF